MKAIICDRCGAKVPEEENITRLHFGYTAIGWHKFEDLCPGCGFWLLTFLNGEKMIRLRSEQENK